MVTWYLVYDRNTPALFTHNNPSNPAYAEKPSLPNPPGANSVPTLSYITIITIYWQGLALYTKDSQKFPAQKNMEIEIFR